MPSVENPLGGSADGQQQQGSAELRRPLSGDFVAQGSQLTFEFDEERGGKQNALSKVGKSVLSSADERLQAQGLRKQTFANSMLQSVDVQTGVVFNEDSASKTLYSTITSEKVKEKVTRILKDMHEHAESQQHTMRDEMDYQEILSTGILYEGEHLIDGLEPPTRSLACPGGRRGGSRTITSLPSRGRRARLTPESPKVRHAFAALGLVRRFGRV